MKIKEAAQHAMLKAGCSKLLAVGLSLSSIFLASCTQYQNQVETLNRAMERVYGTSMRPDIVMKRREMCASKLRKLPEANSKTYCECVGDIDFRITGIHRSQVGVFLDAYGKGHTDLASQIYAKSAIVREVADACGSPL